jgi:tetratricopeptide (TPR) repeat protein
MKVVLFFILTSVLTTDISKISKINKAKSNGEAAYANGDYEAAIAAFKLLTDSLDVREDPILLNLANAYFMQSDTSNALKYYALVTGSEDRTLQSLAYQQLGVIKQQQNKHQEALTDFKASLKSNPGNEDARYNYELLKKLMKDQEQEQQNKNEDIEPSEYAKKLKAQADELVKQNLFENALTLMMKGLEEDETVAAYNSFITKLNDVVESKQ